MTERVAMTLDLSLLPPTARDLADLIGLPATLRLVEGWGGRAVQIARGKRAKGKAQLDELAAIVGRLEANKLAQRYGGGVLTIPLCADALRGARDGALQSRFDALTTTAGHSARQAVALLVGEFGIHESTVWRALKRPTMATEQVAVRDDRQMGLFA